MTVVTRRFPLVATCVCAAGVFVLCYLGVWQVGRLAWKENLQSQLDKAYAKNAPPHPLTQDDFMIDDAHHMVRGHIPLTIDPGKAVLLNGRLMDGKQAVAVVAPAISPSLTKSVMLEIGCSPTFDIDDLHRRPERTIDAKGLVRLPNWSFFTPDNRPDKGKWWRLDSKDFMVYYRQPFYPAYLTLENSQELVRGLGSCPVEHTLRNDHLSYAIFWFTMAGVLAVMWGLRFLRPYLQSA